jgi:hypothetical protein
MKRVIEAIVVFSVFLAGAFMAPIDSAEQDKIAAHEHCVVSYSLKCE